MQGSLSRGIEIEGRTQLLLAGVLGVLLGIAFAYAPAVYVALAVVAVFAVVLAVRWPQLAMVGMIVMLSTVLPGTAIPKINAGTFKVWATDLIIIGSLVLITVRFLVDRRFVLVRSPVVLPLALFTLWTLISSLRGYYFDGHLRNDVVIETRIAMYYLTAICALFLVRAKDGLHFTIRAMSFFATVAAVAMIIQYVLGAQVAFLPAGRTYEFTESGTADITRVKDTIGEGLVTMVFIIKTVTMFINKLRFRKLIDLAQWLIIGLGLLTTFNRTHWIMVALAILITLMLVSSEERRRFVGWALFLLFVIIFASAFFGFVLPESKVTRFLGAAGGRFVTITQGESYTDPRTSTLQWRNFEYEYGIPQIYQHPLMGLGLGAAYRPRLSVDHAGFEGWKYTHNSNLWIAMKTGLVGFFFYLWFMLAFVWHGLRKWRAISHVTYRGFVLGSALGVLVLLPGANLHPFGMMLEWVPVIALAIGLSEALIYNYANRAGRAAV